MLFSFPKKNPQEELESLKKAFEIVNERYQKKTISLEKFTKQCDIITKKINKCEKKINKNN